MNYKETINYLFTRLPMFQRTGPAAYKDNLDNILRMDELYGHPHQKYQTIHIAGTNGKGSVSHMLASVLQSAGLKVGLYTSPHLKDFRERIRVNGKMIPKDFLCNWVSAYRTNNKLWKIEPSFFELTVALAFDFFAKEKVDVAVMEVGLGGRLDSTNIIHPELGIITNIGLDHTNLLGDTLEKIAEEKAGIIKEGIPVVIGTTQKETKPVFTEKAKEKKAAICFADEDYEVVYSTLNLDGKQNLCVEKNGLAVYEGLKLDLLGTYQHKNIPAVLKAVDVLNEKGFSITGKAVYEGLSSVVENTGLLGRWQVVGNNPLVVCDTGHNEEGIREIVKQLDNTAYKSLHIVFGTVGDKDPDKVLELLPQNATYYFVKADIARAMDARELAERASGFGLRGSSHSSVLEGFKLALTVAEKNDLVFVGGSTFVVAEVL